jgi:hypothetical protein
MSTPFEIESFEEYLQTVRNELPQDARKYFRGQTKLVSAVTSSSLPSDAMHTH